MASKATYYGKPLEDYTKKELIAIIIEMGQQHERDRQECRETLDSIIGLTYAD